MIVVDAAVLAPALADDGPDGKAARQRLGGEAIATPEIVDLEVASVWRRAVHAGHSTRGGPPKPWRTSTRFLSLGRATGC